MEAKDTPFQFLGFTIRYDADIHGRQKRYWNIQPSDKSERKVREKLKVFLKYAGHYDGQAVSKGISTIIRGWLNYFDIPKVSYPAMSRRHLRYYLVQKLYRYYNRKSQRRSRLYGTQAFEVLVQKHGLIDPSKFSVGG
ncbi:MAG: hypothetical protein L0Y56_14490 [Nitrospira sp.]|nr:hypothetical protein [Nitrospira sp.]